MLRAAGKANRPPPGDHFYMLFGADQLQAKLPVGADRLELTNPSHESLPGLPSGFPVSDQLQAKLPVGAYQPELTNP